MFPAKIQLNNDIMTTELTRKLRKFSSPWTTSYITNSTTPLRKITFVTSKSPLSTIVTILTSVETIRFATRSQTDTWLSRIQEFKILQF